MDYENNNYNVVQFQEKTNEIQERPAKQLSKTVKRSGRLRTVWETEFKNMSINI